MYCAFRQTCQIHVNAVPNVSAPDTFSILINSRKGYTTFSNYIKIFIYRLLLCVICVCDSHIDLFSFSGIHTPMNTKYNLRILLNYDVFIVLKENCVYIRSIQAEFFLLLSFFDFLFFYLTNGGKERNMELKRIYTTE
jgi:hypothetical protein